MQGLLDRSSLAQSEPSPFPWLHLPDAKANVKRDDSDQPKRQLAPKMAFVLLHKIRNGSGQFAHLQIAAPPKFMGDILGYVLGPSLLGVEFDDADRIVVLARKEILDNGFQVCGFVIGFEQQIWTNAIHAPLTVK